MDVDDGVATRRGHAPGAIGPMMRVAVDADRCEGHARCWDLCPEVFDLDDEGHAVVRFAEVPVALEAKVEQAARNCPERAITVDRP